MPFAIVVCRIRETKQIYLCVFYFSILLLNLGIFLIVVLIWWLFVYICIKNKLLNLFLLCCFQNSKTRSKTRTGVFSRFTEFSPMWADYWAKIDGDSLSSSHNCMLGFQKGFLSSFYALFIWKICTCFKFHLQKIYANWVMFWFSRYF